MLSVLAIALAFMIGSIPTAFLMGRLKGIDIRRHGSGNVGATNAFRILGKGWGVACLALDIAKGLLPVALLFPGEVFGFAGWPIDGWKWVIGAAAIAGHMFSPFLRFRGGKGVATSLGVLVAIAPLPVVIVFFMGLFIIWLTGYVSLASIAGAVALPLLILVLQWRTHPWVSAAMTALLGLIIVWKHRSNIARLRAGTEKRIFDRLRGNTPSSGDRAS